jgi:hypothetical protein
VGFNDNATFSYTVTNVCGVPANATVTIDVNRRPTANADAAVTPRNRAVVVPVLANDVDPDLPSDVLNVVLVPGSATNRARVTVVDGGVRFDPDRRFSGNASFQYYVQDSGGLTSNPVTVTVSVGVNSPPVAGDFSVSTFNDAGAISVNVFQPPTGDPDDDNLELLPGVTVSPLSAGVASGTGETVRFNPASNLVPGQVITLTYSITDGESTTNGTITVTVQNRAPTAGNDSASGGLTGTINVLANDTDPDSDTLTVTGSSIDSVSRVDPPPQPTTDPTDTTTAPTVPPNPGVSTSYTATTVSYSVSDPTFVGTIVLSYTISDGHGGSASGKITINVS